MKWRRIELYGCDLIWWVVEPCSLWNNRYHCGAVCITEEFLFFQDFAQEACFQVPLSTIIELRTQDIDYLSVIVVESQDTENVRVMISLDPFLSSSPHIPCFM